MCNTSCIRKYNEINVFLFHIFFQDRNNFKPEDEESGNKDNNLQATDFDIVVSQSNILQTHQAVHTSIKSRKRNGKDRYVCPQCGKSFEHRYCLRRHDRVHTGERPYVCDVCAKGFSLPSNLTRHKRTHTKAPRKPPAKKSHQCFECGKVFDENYMLQRHTLVHTGEQPYVCDVCCRAFSKIGNLRRHKRVHSGEKPYICEECGKQFTQLNHLQRHQMGHSGRRPYGCRICHQSFAGKGDLTVHTSVHSNERPYLCSVCGVAFKAQQPLSRHMRRVHQKDVKKAQ